MKRSSLTAGLWEAGLQAALLLVLLAAVYPKFFFRGEMLAPGDLLFLSRPWDQYAPPDWPGPVNRLMPDVITAFVPYYAVSKMAVEAGEWPLWNPFELAGMPLLANAQSAVFYPPRVLHMLLPDLHLATSLYIVLKLWLCGMTAYACGRGLGLGIGASRFLSIAWMLASYNVLWAYWSLPDVSVWLPVLFLGIEWIIRERYRRGFFATALGGAMLLMAGHPETAFAMGVGVGVYFLLRLAWERRWGRRLWTPVGVTAGAWALALLYCAAMLVPFIEYLTHSSTFFSRADEGTELFMAPGGVACFWAPRFYGTSAEDNFWGWDLIGTSNPYMALYSGVGVWLCLGLLLTRGALPPDRRGLVACLLAAGLFSGLLAFGAPGIASLNHLPVFRSMIPFYHNAFVIFAVPVLAAFGFEHWFSRPRRLREILPVLPLLALAALILYALIAFNGSLLAFAGHLSYVWRQVAVAALAAAASLIPMVAYCFWRRPRLLGFALTLVVAADLLYAVRGLSPSLPRRYLYPDTKLTQFLQDLPEPTRVGVGEGGIASGLLAPYGIQEILGYDGLYPARIIRFQETLKRDLWNAMMPAMAIRYYLHDPRYGPEFPMDEQPDRFEYVTEADKIAVYRDTKAFERAYLVPQAKVVSDADEMLELLGSEGFRPDQLVLVEEAIPDLPTEVPASQGSPGTARVTDYGFTRVDVDVEAARPGVLVLADAYYPGWGATIDGQRTELFPANYVLRGVVVPEGKHRVRFHYFPPSLQIGLALSIGACLGTLAYAACYLRRRPSTTRPA